MKLTARILGIGIGLVATFLVGVALAQALGGRGLIRGFDGAEAADFVSTTSTTFVDMPGMTVTFDLPVSGHSVVVMFTGEFPTGPAPCENQNYLSVQLVIDGVVHSAPGGVQFFTSDPVTSGGFNFISDPLLTGTHVAKIQWKANLTGGCALNRSMTVLHR